MQQNRTTRSSCRPSQQTRKTGPRQNFRQAVQAPWCRKTYAGWWQPRLADRPFTYSQIIPALLAGHFVLSDLPDRRMLLACTVILRGHARQCAPRLFPHPAEAEMVDQVVEERAHLAG